MEFFRYRWRLQALQRQRDREQADYIKLTREVKAEHGSRSSEYLDICSEAFAHNEISGQKIAELQSRRLIALAERLWLPTPETSDEAAWDGEFGQRFGILSRSTMAELRSRIRREQHEASQIVFAWLGGLTGILGTAIGLVSLLKG
jgi:hypothetical protein